MATDLPSPSTIQDAVQWTDWYPLAGTGRNRALPRSPGLYRIRRIGRTDLDYIGQTGLALSQRLGMLAGVYAAEMPYSDPHTAAPALWAQLQATDCDFEVSVAPITGDTTWRKGLEAVAIAQYRAVVGVFPTFQFGRMPAGYRKSSGNNARLVTQGRRFRGGPTDVVDASHGPSLPVDQARLAAAFSLDDQRASWSAWTALSADTLTSLPPESGLYLIRCRPPGALLYVGQGVIRARLHAHLA